LVGPRKALFLGWTSSVTNDVPYGTDFGAMLSLLRSSARVDQVEMVNELAGRRC
jgi:hypothetical protein